jgi:hypothetical protein
MDGGGDPTAFCGSLAKEKSLLGLTTQEGFFWPASIARQAYM